MSFYSEEDFKSWFGRVLRIQRLGKAEEFSLGHCTDRKGVEDFYLRIDVQLSYITSTEKPNIHIRKMPKVKYPWEYLKDNGMLDDDGIVLIAVYPGHAEGTAEGEMLLSNLSSEYDRRTYCVSLFKIINSPTSPFVISVEKK